MHAVPRLLPVLLAFAPAFLPSPAAAASPADAQALQAQLQGWLAGLVGPGLTMPDGLFQVTADGDRYRLELPVAGTVGTTGVVVSGPPMSALLRPQPNGSWLVEQVNASSPLRVDNPNAPDGMPTSWSMTLDSQESHGEVDPTFTGPSRMEAVIEGYSVTSSGSKGDQSTHIDRFTSNSQWRPVGDGRLELTGDSTGDNLVVDQTAPDGTEVRVTARTVRSSGKVDGFAPDRLGEVIRGIGAMVPMVRQAQAAGGKGVPEEMRAPARKMVLALADLLRGMDSTTSLDTMEVQTGGHGVTLRKLVIGSTAGVRDGQLSLKMLMMLDGLDSQEIPPGPYRTYLPRHIALKPVLSGVSSDGLVTLMLHAIDANPDDQAAQAQLQAEGMALLARGPLAVGLEDVTIDIGPASLHAHGSMLVPSPDAVTGNAEITADGLDSLMRDVGKTQELAQAMPVLAFLKGMGRQEGATTHWTIAYANGHTTVNGTDLSALMPKGNDQQRPPQQRPARPPTAR